MSRKSRSVQRRCEISDWAASAKVVRYRAKSSDPATNSSSPDAPAAGSGARVSERYSTYRHPFGELPVSNAVRRVASRVTGINVFASATNARRVIGLRYPRPTVTFFMHGHAFAEEQLPDNTTAFRRASATVQPFGSDPKPFVAFGRGPWALIHFQSSGFRRFRRWSGHADKDEAPDEGRQSNPTALERLKGVDHPGQRHD